MRSLVYLTRRYLAAHPLPVMLLAGALALTFALPLVARVLVSGLEQRLSARAAATPLVIGERGSRFDMVLDALYFRRTGTQPVDAALYDRLAAEPDVLVVPLDARFTARERPLVGTAVEYFEQRSLRARRGTLPLTIGDCVLGASIARELRLDVGDTLFSDPTDLYDITKPQALELNVCGVLRPSGGPDDEAVFCDLKTVWILDGLLHGHGDVDADVDPSLVLGRDETRTTLSPAFRSVGQVTLDNLASFHLHGDREQLPISVLLAFPRTSKAGTLLENRINVEGAYSAVRPADVVTELLARVFQLRQVLDGMALLLGLCTLLLAALILGLSSRLREAEIRSLDLLGAPRRTVRALVVAPALVVLCLALALALMLAAVVRWSAFDPTRLL